jgi:cytochrome b involved in lipid metabolism
MKTILAALLLVSAVMAGGCVQSGTNSTVNKTYTLQDVAAHASASDCWLVLHEKVYNVTAMVGGHPGGPAILQGCGKDATTLFETRPMGSGTPHSQQARDFAEKFYIGDLR